MKRQINLIGLFFIALVLSVAFTTSAQPDDDAAEDQSVTCEVDFEEIIQAVEQVCTGIGRDQVCYGNINVNAIPRTEQLNLILMNQVIVPMFH